MITRHIKTELYVNFIINVALIYNINKYLSHYFHCYAQEVEIKFNNNHLNNKEILLDVNLISTPKECFMLTSHNLQEPAVIRQAKRSLFSGFSKHIAWYRS